MLGGGARNMTHTHLPQIHHKSRRELMTVKLSCRCGQHIEVNRSAAGQTFRCPTCNILLAVPHVPITSGKIEAYEPVFSIQLTKQKLKQAIIISVLVVISGVVVGISGVAIHKRPVLIIGSVMASVGIGWLLTVRSQTRRSHLKK
jgi:hypothetical protein